eukprot:CAMPEP_0202352614 /NCGR_PEP_ID=MMETSP1126-20121109/8730_1 /ASSEMBLY_ACC=CAM_ASM_000457 /TAXON_ID=3047 /ORGANISM="Dunaliella tertiolecta, Strain CCMP1320" /LENGTH=232 /DNA_ID=CAMNT_0048944849 /DNA_START=37 /DNA_END=735 /DNA_ORIENTATION=+
MALLSSSLKLAGPHSLLRPRGIPTVSAVSPHTEAVVEVHCAKDRCVHPGRPASELCKDCPRRKQKKKSMSAMASAEDVARLEGLLAKPCALLDVGVEEAVVEVHCAKDKCAHPGRSASELCKDCPRRKQKKSMSAMASSEDVARLEVLLAAPCAGLNTGPEVTTAAKSKKCIHPMRPLQGSCRDCPRRKGMRGMINEEVQEPIFTVFAAKGKCVHPARPVKDACPDCPRKRK